MNIELMTMSFLIFSHMMRN